MIVSIVAAIGKNGQLGIDNKIPWTLKEDMQNFKDLTLNHHILMGRRTFESIGGKPLKNRINLLVTRNKNIDPKGCEVFDCSYKAMDFAKSNKEKEIFIIGGTTIYKFFLDNNLADKMYITETTYDGNADTFFPNFNLISALILFCYVFYRRVWSIYLKMFYHIRPKTKKANPFYRLNFLKAKMKYKKEETVPWFLRSCLLP